jgi:hypothetical protein
MKRPAYLAVLLLPLLWVAHPAQGEPAWGVNCLSCHGTWQTDAVQMFGEDTIADPDESATGAPDRGPLKVFQATAGQTKTLYAEILGLEAGDVYAVELKRIRFPGVVNGGELTYTDDCGWAYWGVPGKYYTDPAIGYPWGTGPTTFAFDVGVNPDAPADYYDLAFAVAGKLANGGDLFYAEEHFYLEVSAPLLPGDFDQDGDVDLDDFYVFATCFEGDGGRLDPACTQGDFDNDGDVDCLDWQLFRQAWTEPEDPPELAGCREAIPTVSEWGMIAMLLLIAAAGTLVFRRRDVRAVE